MSSNIQTTFSTQYKLVSRVYEDKMSAPLPLIWGWKYFPSWLIEYWHDAWQVFLRFLFFWCLSLVIFLALSSLLAPLGYTIIFRLNYMWISTCVYLWCSKVPISICELSFRYRCIFLSIPHTLKINNWKKWACCSPPSLPKFVLSSRPP